MKSHHVLLVEDDPDDIELFQEALRETEIPHFVDVLAEGDRVIPALKAAEKLPDIIVLDLNLPKTPGKDVLKELKSLPTLSTIPVVILTTSNSRNDMEECLRFGAEKFLTKPVNTDGFKEMAEEIFRISNR